MAVTAKTARGAARKPGGAARRHAQVVPDFQERNGHMRLLELALSEHRAMQAMGHELLLDDSAYARALTASLMRAGISRAGCSAKSTPPPEPSRRRRRSDFAIGLRHRARPLPRPDFCVHRAQGGTAWARC
ncbi:hypothetical protein CFM90_07785 [Ralstonia solanacearum]|nr:hypothetical protein CFM90_07785 [Ralstonia solanacearum]